MADRQERLGIVVYVEDQATGKLSRVKAEIAGMGPAGSSAGRGLATGAASIEKSAGRIGGALSHAKGAIGGLLTGPLGILGLGAGLFSLTTFLDSSLHKASDFAVQIEKLTGLTGESAQAMGALLLLTDKYGISAERTGMIVGFAEKTLGKLNDTTAKAKQAEKSAALATLEAEKLRLQAVGASTKTVNKLISEQKALDAIHTKSTGSLTALTALENQYGISLHDSRGRVINFSTELSRLSDYYTSNATASDKAALTAKLFGRGYADMIPILRLGSKGIREQEQAYKDFGLQLGTNTQDTLKVYQSSIRQVGEAVDILQLQLGLALAPMITKAADAFSLFLEHGGAKQIVGVFESVALFAEGVGGAIEHYVIPAFGAIKAGWDTLPKPLRDGLIMAQVGGKTMKFLFGVDLSPTALAGDLIKKLGVSLLGGIVKSFAQRGGTPANPLFVADVAGGLKGGLPVPGGGGLGSKILTGMSVALAATAVAAAVQTYFDQKQGIDAKTADIQSTLDKSLASGPSVADLQTKLAAINTGIDKISSNPLNMILGGDALDQLKGMRGEVERALDLKTHGLGGTLAGDRAVAQTALTNAGVHNFAAATTALGLIAHKFDKPAWLAHWEATMGRTPKALAAAMHAALLAVQGGHATVGQVSLLGANAGRGSATSVRGEIAALAKLLSTTHDPTLQAAITRSLGQLQASLPKHDQVAAAYAQAEKIALSTASTAAKVADLQKIKADMAKVSPTVAAKVGQLIHTVQTKKLSTTVNVGGAKANVKVPIVVYDYADGRPDRVITSGISGGVSGGGTSGRLNFGSGGAGLAKFPTRATFGEAGTEGVAIIRNPRPFRGDESLGGGGAPITLHVNPVTKVSVSARDVEARHNERNFYARGRMLNRVSYGTVG